MVGQTGRIAGTRQHPEHDMNSRWTHSRADGGRNDTRTNTRRLLAIVFLALAATPLWAGVQARLERSIIQDGDTVTLTIETDGSNEEARPDLSVLEKDFDVLGTSETRQIRILNGHRSDKRLWQVELDPHHGGTLRIPPIPVGTEKTAPLTLKVVAQAPAAAGDGRGPVFMKTELEPAGTSPRVQQQLLYRVRLYYRVPLVEGSFSDLKIKDAVVERLGEDSQYQTTIGGQRYQVIERRYAIFPEKSGTLEIPPIRFDGRLMAASGQRFPSTGIDSMMRRFFGNQNPFDDAFFAGTPFGNAGKRVRVRSEPLKLEVRGRPAGYHGSDWLPAAALKLTDSWAAGPPEFRVGEPVTRTITLEAKGLESSQIPDIHIPEVEGVRLYPEQPVTENRTDGEWVFGTRKQSVAYVATRPGTVKLPAIRVDWWDTGAEKQRSSVIPAWEVRVLPAAGGTSAALPPAAPASKPTAAAPVAASASTPESSGTWRQPLYRYWPWAAGGVLLLVTGLALLRLRTSGRERARSNAEQPAPAAPARRSGDLRRKLQQACEHNDAAAAEQLLLEWAAREWPEDPPRNLAALAARLETGVDEVLRLERARYGASNGDWDGGPLWEAFRNGLQIRKTGSTDSDDALSPLYPKWS
ncbi:MAG TPA: protein BatD [Gammaproteobacteria bacterium]|nr:protein BatD [Gammaproteobacteria bacterium]